MTLENTIISNLIYNEEYFKKVFPYIKEEYFDEIVSKKILNSLSEYVSEYQGLPSVEALKITLEDRKDLNETMFKEVIEKVESLKTDPTTDYEWLLDQTEKFCQDKDLYNSIRKSILIYDGQDKEFDKGAIPELLSKSLAISFDTHIGHDFLEDYNSRYEYYHRKEERIPFDIDIFNTITKGGLPKKSLTLLLGATGTGKSIVKCHMAAAHLLFGKNVLYITAELSEEEVGRRIDANIMDITLDEVADLPLSTYEKRMSRFKDKTCGKLIIKEYPTSSAHVGHFRHLLNELRMKKNFKPDVIYLDYLNICASSRLKGNSAANSYTLVKSIAEEVRGLAVEYNVPIVSSSQLNRDGYNNSDVDLTNTSESMGITHTADAIFALITSEDLEASKQLMIKQLKNRWGDLNNFRKFVVGLDKSRMKLYNAEKKLPQNQNSISQNVTLDQSDNKTQVEDDAIFKDDFKPVLNKKDGKNKLFNVGGFQ
jgi:archaellum biogenesis ATPase FlaH